MHPLQSQPPFQPIRSTLYSPAELLDRFDPGAPQSFQDSPDFAAYRYFISNGRAMADDPYVSMMQALHDNSILRALWRHIKTAERPVVAIMGGHKLARNSDDYAQVAHMARNLSRGGFLVASGGGPGAMEASHLGALLSGHDEAALDGAIRMLALVPDFPRNAEPFKQNGDPDTDAIARLHAWIKPAMELSREFAGGGESLGVPTWHYGHEPMTPFASHVAKFFLNSIREDVLLTLATNGIVYAPGAAGTMQEVFQDAAQNYYASDAQAFAPMVFLNVKHWRHTLPLEALLHALFSPKNPAAPSPDELVRHARYQQKVLFTDDTDEAIAHLRRHLPAREQAANRLKSLSCSPAVTEGQA